MANRTATTQGKEQLILLPTHNQSFTLTADPPGSVVLLTGSHAVVVSGYAIYEWDGQPQPGGLVNLLGDDDDIEKTKVEVIVGPLWRDVRQVSALLTGAGIVSGDSDEVDHSCWVVRSLTWDVVQEPGGERIRLKFRVEVQGIENGFVNFGYQFTATGSLARLPTIEEISANFT